MAKWAEIRRSLWNPGSSLFEVQQVTHCSTFDTSEIESFPPRKLMQAAGGRGGWPKLPHTATWTLQRSWMKGFVSICSNTPNMHVNPHAGWISRGGQELSEPHWQAVLLNHIPEPCWHPRRFPHRNELVCEMGYRWTYQETVPQKGWQDEGLVAREHRSPQQPPLSNWWASFNAMNSSNSSCWCWRQIRIN